MPGYGSSRCSFDSFGNFTHSTIHRTGCFNLLHLSLTLIGDGLLWTISVLASRSIHQAQTVLDPDVLLRWWAVHCNVLHTQGCWTPVEDSLHISYLKLLAIFHSLISFSSPQICDSDCHRQHGGNVLCQLAGGWHLPLRFCPGPLGLVHIRTDPYFYHTWSHGAQQPGQSSEAIDSHGAWMIFEPGIFSSNILPVWLPQCRCLCNMRKYQVSSVFIVGITLGKIRCGYICSNLEHSSILRISAVPPHSSGYLKGLSRCHLMHSNDTVVALAGIVPVPPLSIPLQPHSPSQGSGSSLPAG